MSRKSTTTQEQKEILQKWLFEKPRTKSNLEIAVLAGVTPMVVSQHNVKWGLAKKRRSRKAKGTKVRVIKGTEFMGKTKKPEITDEMTVLYGLQKTYNHLSIVDKAVFLADLRKFVEKETANINSLSL